MSNREEIAAIIDAAGFDPARTLVCDTECYPNFWSIGFWRVSDGKTLVMEHSERKPFTDANRDRIRNLMRSNTMIGYNFLNYDQGMIAHAIDGATNAQLKSLNDRIILGNLRYWQLRDLDIYIPESWDVVDLIEPQPNAIASLKTLAGRMHAPLMQDLPFHPDQVLTEEEMDKVLFYMGNDLQNTDLLRQHLIDALQMRRAIGADFGLNFMSKSDAQMGEAMIKSRVERMTGSRVYKVETPPGTTFNYNPPKWLKFETPQLQAILERVRGSEFYIKGGKDAGKVQAPKWLEEESRIVIGETEYAMGIGGLHSTEKNRAVHSDEDYVLFDFDVASYYPAIILNAGLYPKALGREFIDVYREIRDERVAAKRAGDKTKDKGLKIALNGCFGKLGSKYSVLYAPHLMIAITLGGQLALLMLIERAERAGIQVVSGNTDGVVFRCPRELAGNVVKQRLDGGLLAEIVEEWERETGFELEATEYSSLYNESVNSYLAFQPDGKVKVKGKGWTGRHDNDIRTQLMKNPFAEVVTLAVIAYIRDGVPLEETIRACTDLRDFVSVVNVKGGGTWRGEYLGKVVRYYWSTDGDGIFYKEANESTGNHKQVSNTDGAKPLMNLPADGALPDDIDYDRYVHEAREKLMNIGFDKRPEKVRPLRIYKWSAMAWFAVAV
ncbi:hypothetical protein [Sphingobium lignivorans]|uniref:DNA-directed DNA polymerase n=1 Tax=Sphingobium lignivorans TaxID=2735886 RepID=A0ABR6NFG2_9SPHN|nr:hypothetical protein [Sphingobium lignivorans]MBB5986015.1 hypothetical protein [Sphingobium lignivorans]